MGTEITGHIDHRSHADRGLTEQPTIHEGVVARALEKKGVISDRCEINRQIKADNALLRELKATVKKLMQAVKNSVPAIAEALEKLRSSILIFSYQLRYIGVGKNRMGKRVDAVKPELERYASLVQQSQYHQLCWWFAITPPGSFVFPPKGGLTNRSFLLLVTA